MFLCVWIYLRSRYTEIYKQRCVLVCFFLFSFLSFLLCCAQSCPTHATPWTVARQAPASMELFRQEYWSGLPVPSLGAMPRPRMEPASLAAPASTGRVLAASAPWGLPLWLSWERICLQCGRPGFDPWVGKIPWRREWLPTPVSWPGEFRRLYSPRGRKESDTTEHFH